MSAPMGGRFKFVCFTIEGLNSFATVIYFYYLYFFTRDRFGFGDKANLAFAAFLGFVYALAAWQAGKFARRCGYFLALKLGFLIMAASLAAGLFLDTAAGQIAAASCVTIGMCFIWPTLEALVSEGEDAVGLPRVVGIYNVTWAVTNAVAYFVGGTLIVAAQFTAQKYLHDTDKNAGYKIIFLLPLVIVLIQLAMTFWLQRHAAEQAREAPDQSAATGTPHQPASPRAKAFLKMAWLANPFAYVAIQTLIAVIPGIAAKFHLSTMAAGFICTLWCFVRLGAFFALWHWTAWHYRFRWLVASFIALIISFAVILMSPSLGVLIAAQIFFGGAIGLIYYSSLFYSMDVGEASSEHGGIHEAAIGLGNCVGPAVGALSLQFLPQFQNSSAIAVSVLLLGGFFGLMAIWKSAK